MYHYRESGLRNIYLANGYREIETPYGRATAIDDVHGLHKAIVHDLVSTKPALSGAEVRFIRKFIGLTQTAFADLLGVEDQSVRRWEKLARIPKQADRSVRLVAREHLEALDMPFAELLERIAKAQPPAKYQYRHRAHAWQPHSAAA